MCWGDSHDFTFTQENLNLACSVGFCGIAVVGARRTQHQTLDKIATDETVTTILDSFSSMMTTTTYDGDGYVKTLVDDNNNNDVVSVSQHSMITVKRSNVTTKISSGIVQECQVSG